MGAGADVLLMTLARAIVEGDRERSSGLLAVAPDLALTRFAVGGTRPGAEEYFLEAIEHYVYRGDSALHIAAAAFDPGIVRELVGQLAHWPTGRPGSGSAEARAQQDEITHLLHASGGL